MYKKITTGILGISLAFMITACEKKIETGVHDIHWDRDMCKRCIMVVSDRNQTVQVINPKDGEKYVFDDIGCTILWFKDQDIKWKDDAVIWINDFKTAKWIDARNAFYDTMNVTPMAYGFGAHEQKDSIQAGLEIINYQEVEKRILKIGR